MAASKLHASFGCVLMCAAFGGGGEGMPFIAVDSWAGRRFLLVEVVSETAKSYRVRLLQDGRLPGRNRWGSAGQIVLVPRSALWEKRPARG